MMIKLNLPPAGDADGPLYNYTRRDVKALLSTLDVTDGCVDFHQLQRFALKCISSILLPHSRQCNNRG